MKDRIISIIKCIIMLVIVLVLFTSSKEYNKEITASKNASLIIYGDTIASGYNPIIENDRIYFRYGCTNDDIYNNNYRCN